MNVKIYKSRFILEHKFSGSKSLTHRYLIGAFLLNNGIILQLPRGIYEALNRAIINEM